MKNKLVIKLSALAAFLIFSQLAVADFWGGAGSAICGVFRNVVC